MVIVLLVMRRTISSCLAALERVFLKEAGRVLRARPLRELLWLQQQRLFLTLHRILSLVRQFNIFNYPCLHCEHHWRKSGW